MKSGQAQADALAQIADAKGPPAAVRRKLADERRSITHKFSVAGHEGYIHVGLYESGEPGEIFIRMAKEGSTISGLMDSFGTAISLAFQHGVPLKLLVDKFTRTKFDPSGFTGNPEIPRASSIMDYIFRWLGSKFVKEDRAESESEFDTSGDLRRVSQVVATATATPMPSLSASSSTGSKVEVIDATNLNGNFNFIARSDAPTCPECGSIMIPNGSCHKCVNCGTTSGCS
jgi:ribonucleoside-diphosphate reductase alpha chain